jgi:hypothetical protein
MVWEKPWTLALLPLALAVPLVTLVNAVRELAFVLRWAGGHNGGQQARVLYPGRWPDPEQYPEAGL